MKNNNIKFRILLLILMVFTFFTGCDLDEVPEDFLALDQFYKTESQANAGVIGVYSLLYNLQGPKGLFAFTEIGTDNVGGAPTYFVKTYNPPTITIDPGDNVISNYYLYAYEAINAANAVVDKVSESDLSESFISEIVAEAKLLRASIYFDMVRLFGDIVVFDNTTTSLEGLEKARSSEDEVYAKIVDDLTEAEENLSDDGLDTGRANKWVAKALLAKVYLTIGSYSDAASKTDEIISSDRYSLVSEYNELFKPGNSSLDSEIMFALQYSANYRCAFSLWLAPTSGSGSSVFYADRDLYSESIYEANDLRKEWTVYDSIQYDGKLYYNEGYTYFLKFAEDYLIDLVPQAELGEYNYPVLRYADVLLMNSEAIARRDGSPENAYEGINAVRARSGLSSLSSLTQEEFMEKLLHERRVELVLESHRWFDLKRFGKLYEVMSHFSGYQTYHELYPIPSNALTANPALTQNEGY